MMIDEKKMQQLDMAFQRILTLPLSKSSFRQMQNAILFCLDGDREASTQLLDALLKVPQESKNASKPGQDANLQKLVDRFSLQISVAREVSERGDFLSIVTSDIINHPEMPLFGNRIRRVDGQEFDFITNAESAIQLLHHFSSRLQEMEKLEKSREVLKGAKKELISLKNRIDQLIQNSSE
jgi:hypothetical protein